MANGEIIKEVFGAIPRFTTDFVNVVASPRGYARTGRLFMPERFADALVFLGASLVVTMILRAPMWREREDLFLFLAADATWKFAVVLLETAVIAVVWRLLRGRVHASGYLVANAFYFGVVTIAVHFVMLLGWSAERQMDLPPILLVACRMVTVAFAVGALSWCLVAWRAYGDMNDASLARTILALVLVMVCSVPVVVAGVLLRDALLKRF